jgi:aspartate-semialdehyde dehydrogenase
MTTKKRRAAVVGATGVAGQQFLTALDDHPWFEVTAVAASERSAGRTYRDAIHDQNGARQWWCAGDPARAVLGLTVQNARDFDPGTVDVIFSAVESDAARELEPRFAAEVPVLSTASAFRYEPDVPIVIPGINLGHVALIDVQRRRRGWKGFVIPGPNCTVTGLAITLKPLLDRFGVRHVIMTSMQSVSGAGRAGGVLGLDIIDNIIPFISGEEGKVEREAVKVLGALSGDGIAPAAFSVSATCTRAAVLEGHTEAVVVATEEPCTPAEAAAAMTEFDGDIVGLDLPSAPPRLIAVHTDPYRPQPRLDRDAGGGMTTSVGRLRPEQTFGHGVKYMLVSHNTQMGAAKGAVLIAEYLAHTGRL